MYDSLMADSLVWGWNASIIPGIDFRGPKKYWMEKWKCSVNSYLRAPRENLIGEEDVVEDLPSEPNDFLAEENFPLDEMADVAFAAEA